MYRTKKDVDIHAESLKSKLNQKEFNSRAQSIARLYFEVGDYASCRKYVELYIADKENNASAHKLLGQAFENLGLKDKALEEYQTAYNLEPSQTSLVLDICRLLADAEIIVDPGKTKFWCDKAEAIYPKHTITLHLREQLVSNDPKALLKLLKLEISAHPKDATLHARLLRHYMQYNMCQEAFEHGCKIEFCGNRIFNNIAWYEMLSEVLKQQPTLKSWKYNLMLLTVQENLCLLSLSETPSSNSKSLIEISMFLHQYDQSIETVFKNGTPTGLAEFHLGLLKHHRGQFAFHCATFLLKKAKKDQLKWHDAIISAAPLLLIAWHTIPLATDVEWLKQASETQQAAVRRWYLEGAFRCSQSGHLLTYEKGKNISIIEETSQYCSDSNWKDKLYKKIFTNPDQLDKIKSSHFVSNSLMEIVLQLPKKTEVEIFDLEAQQFYANSLHHLIWILLNYKELYSFKCTIFDMLTSKFSNYPNSGPESLNKLDALAFLYCATLTAQQVFSQNTHNEMSAKLPANITDMLCTLTQMKWWDCAYKFIQNELTTDLTDVRTTLTRGIEVVRCVDNHGLDPELLCKLGHIFIELSKLSTYNIEKNNFIQRARLYYESAIPLLKKLKKNVTIVMPEKRLFDYVHKDLCVNDINFLIEESQLVLGFAFFNENKYDKAIEMLANLKSPKASFYLCQIYKKMASDEYKINGGNMSSDTKFKHVSLLNKAKKCANSTINKLVNVTNSDDINLLRETKEIMDDIEVTLCKFQNNDFNINMSGDGNGSLVDSEDHIQQNNFRNLFSTPKHESGGNLTNYRSIIDSQILDNTQVENKVIEKIDTQIRSLQKRDDTMINFMEQTKNWIDENRNLGNQIILSINTNIKNTIDQFKLLKLSVDQVKDEIIECRTECKDVADLRKEVAELKKEINKLKKSPSEPKIDENNFSYNVEDQYRNNNATAFKPQLPLPNNSLPPFNQGIMQPFPMSLSPYQQLCNQNLINMYSHYSQFAQAPPPPPIFDPARQPVNFSGIYPPPEQLYADMAHLITPGVLPTVAPVSNSTVTSIPTVVTPKPAPPNTANLEQKLPVNVVITSSDPLPTYTTVPAPVLSVVIPPEHIKSTPHNYQIQMPTVNVTQNSTLSDNTAAGPVTFSWNTDIAKVTQSFGNSVPKTTPKVDNSKLSESFGNITASSFNKSRTLSEKSNTSIENYDPCPDFKPIVPLPDEVTVTTGEEDEKTIFAARAKLFRFADKQWKERGVGEIKLLEHKITEKVRVLMRRDQVHKICANHLISSDMKIEPMKNELKAYIWVANDFADENVVLEKFCIRFKTADIGEKFYETFQNSCKKAKDTKVMTTNKCTIKEIVNSNNIEPNNASTPKNDIRTNKTVLGGFTFNSTPTFKTLKDENEKVQNLVDNKSNKVNPFNNVSLKTNLSSTFNNVFKTNLPTDFINVTDKDSSSDLNKSDIVEEYEPNIDFKPVIPLPALVDHVTGEEEENVLFEHRAKLLRYDSSCKEWKERGLGNIKLLVNKENNEKVRLLMRRDQVMNICCNHFITKDITFKIMPNTDKAVTWCAKDFSEGELITETFCLRFKTAEILNEFMKAVKLAQEYRTTNINKQSNIMAHIYESGFADKFKPKPGSWQCDTCYTNNLDSFLKCACCEQEKPLNETSINEIATTKSVSWGNQFKSKPGTWECNQCYVRNEKDSSYCTVCNNPSVKPKAENGVVGVKSTFNFGIPTIISEGVKKETSGWGDQFKPKASSWECQHCFIYNESTVTHCSACNNAKDPSTQKSSALLFGNTSTEPKFTFGIPQKIEKENSSDNISSMFDGTGSHKVTFGMQAPNNNASTTGVGFKFGVSTSCDDPKALSVASNDPITLNKTNEVAKIPLLPTPHKDEVPGSTFGSSSTFSFVFKTPVKGKSPIKPKSEKEEESDDNEYASEDEGHHLHFSPIIPLPDKVEVFTGEENEIEIYSHRAKLFKFASAEWKERGTGTLKILQHKESRKYRVLMRRDQVHKICLNHALTSDVKYIVKDEKSWMFVVNDFSDGEISLNNFCIRFAKPDIALEFKNEVDKILNPKQDEDTDDVVFVDEIKASAEDKERAKALMLPENFFTYINKKPCPGCRGCKEELENDEYTFLSTPSKSDTSTISPTNSAYATPTNANKTIDNSIFRTPLLTISQNSQVKGSLFKNIIASELKDKENNSTTTKNITPTNIFGSTIQNASNNSTTSTPTSIFGSATQSSSNNTINNSTTTKSIAQTSIFDSATQSPSKNTINNSITTKTNTPISIFGSATQNPSNNTINNSTTKSIEPTSIFGSATQSHSNNSINNSVTNKTILKQPTSIFGSVTQNFSEENKNNNFNSTNVFGNLNKFGASFSFCSNEKKNEQDNNISLFGGGVNSKNQIENETNKISPAEFTKSNTAFGLTETQKIGSNLLPTSNTTITNASLTIDENLSFEALSAAAAATGIEKQSEDFKWKGAGQQVFGKGVKKEEVSETVEEDQSGEPYDPHYEPIIPLPKEIVVTTGEEDEEKLFRERSKLYRYNDKTKEWKERGVGEMKILYHPDKKSYRLLLRREQIHKAVLNTLLHIDFELLPMKNSETSWTWSCRNFAENPEGEQETLAVKFKNSTLAQTFKDKVVECVRKLQSLAAQAISQEADKQEVKKHEADKQEAERQEPTPLLRLPKAISMTSRADSALQAVALDTASLTNPTPFVWNTAAISGALAANALNTQENYENDDDDDEDEDDEDVEEEEYDGDYDKVYFTSEAKVMVNTEGMDMQWEQAQVQLFQDQTFEAKLSVTDLPTGEILCDMIVDDYMVFEMINETVVSWTSTDCLTNLAKKVTATFQTIEEAENFYDAYETCKVTYEEES